MSLQKMTNILIVTLPRQQYLIRFSFLVSCVHYSVCHHGNYGCRMIIFNACINLTHIALLFKFSTYPSGHCQTDRWVYFEGKKD